MKRTLALSMLCAAAAVAVSLALGTSAPAGTVTLTASDAGGTTSFNAAGHWDNFAPPSAGNDYVDNQYQLRTPQAAGDFTFAGDSLTMGDGVNSAQLLWKGTTANASITINDLRLNNGSVANGVGGNFTLAGNITLQAGGGSFDYAGNGRSMTVTAPIGGAGDATVINTGTAGNGTIIFAAANSYSGATNVNAGTLRLTDSGALGNTTGVVINTNTGQVSGTGPMLELQNNVSIPAAVSLTMNSVAAGNYRTEFRTNGGNNTWNGPVYLNGDGLTQVAADGAGTLTINGNISAGGSGFTGTLFLRGGGATGTINGTINMPGGTLAKTDDSTWTVGAAGMTYSWGNTSVARGTLKMGAAGVLPSATILNVGQNDNANATLDLNAFDQTIGGLTVNLGTGGTKAITNNGAAAATLTVDNAGNYNFGGVLKNGTSGLRLTKEGAGTLTLSGTADNAGLGITANAGTLVLAKTSTSGVHAVGGGGLTVAGATVQLAGSGGDQIYNNANVAVNSGVFDLNGTSETINGLSGSGGTILNNGGGASTLTVGNNNGGGTYSGTILDQTSGGGTLALTKIGTGTVVLSGANGYSGDTTVLDGTLRAANNAALGPTSGGTIVGGTGTRPSLELGNGVTVTGEPLTLITNSSGDLRAQLAVPGGSTATWNGPITLSGGYVSMLIATGTMTVQGSITGASGTLHVRGTGTGYLDSTLSLGTTLVAKTDTGTWNLRSSGNAWGDTIVAVGTLRLGATNALPTSTVVTMGQNDGNPATFDLNGFNQEIAGLRNNGTGGTKTVTNTGAAATLTVNNSADYTYGYTIAGALSLVKTGAGTLTLGGADTYTGTTTVSNGTLTMTGNRTATSGAITVGNTANNATLNVQNGSYTVGGTFIVGVANSGGSAIVNQSGGSLTLSGTQMIVGNGASGNGEYNLSGGTLTGAASGNRGVILGVNTGTTGTFHLSGTGNLALGSSNLQIARSENTVASSATGVFTQTGGTAVIGTLGIGGLAAVNNANNNGTLSLTGGTFTANAFNALSGGDNSVSNITIGGTAAVTLPAFPTARGTGATATITFDGGTLSPLAASTNYISNMTNAYLTANGANINVASGNDITIPQVLEDAPSQTGRLAKTGVGTLALAGTNTYTGETIIGEGILNVASVSDYGVPSAIGARLQSQENNTPTGIGLHFIGGTLQYTGSTAQSTNREIRISTAGATIDASGSTPAATLSFSHSGANINLFDTPGVRTLTLTGSNTGNNTFAITIENQGGSATTLSKSGTGTWALTGNNTYTGETILGGGILNVASVSDYGVPSAIGARTAAQENNSTTGIGLHFRGGTLQYTGSTPQSTNREIRMLNGAGATIDASGSLPSATLSFTHTGANINLFDTPGTRTLTLTGSNTGDNTFSISLTNQGTNATSLIKRGTGTWVLNPVDGANGSTYTGTTTVAGGELRLASSTALGSTAGGTTIQGNVGGSGVVALTNDITIGETFTLEGRQAGTADIPALSNRSGNNTITAQVLGTTGGNQYNIESQAGKLTLAGGFRQNAGTGDRYWKLMGSGDGEVPGLIEDGTARLDLIKTGAGTWTLTPANTYTGTTTVYDGTLLVNNTAGSGTGSGAVQVNAGTLGGTGSMSGPVTVGDEPTGATAIDSWLAPGNSPGILSTGSLTMNSDAALVAELWGPVAGDPTNGYDQVNVTGDVALSDPRLNLDLQFAPGLGDEFVLVNNDAADAVTGTFYQLPEGAVIKAAFGGFDYPFAISYQGFTGNDVVLTAVPEPASILLAVLGLAGLGLIAWRRRPRS